MAEQKKSLKGTADRFAVRVVTPQGTAAEVETDAVTGPGRLGEFEVLPGHVPFLTELHPGVLVLGEKQREYFAVGAGYLKVGTGGEIEILVDKAIAGADVDVAAARAELDEIGPKVDTWDRALGGEYLSLKDRRDWFAAQLEAQKRAAN